MEILFLLTNVKRSKIQILGKTLAYFQITPYDTKKQYSASNYNQRMRTTQTAQTLLGITQSSKRFICSFQALATQNIFCTYISLKEIEEVIFTGNINKKTVQMCICTHSHDCKIFTDRLTGRQRTSQGTI